MKPSRGRNPLGPDFGELTDGSVQENFLTLSVRDSAAMLDATSGPYYGAPFQIQSPRMPFLKSLTEKPRKLKIAYTFKSPFGGPIHPECQKAVENTLILLKELGHKVEEAFPVLDGKVLAKNFLTLYTSQIAATMDQIEAIRGKFRARAGVEVETKTMALIGRTLSAADYVHAQQYKQHLCRLFGGFFQKYDLVLTPSVAEPPPKLGSQELSFTDTLLGHFVSHLNLGKLTLLSGLVKKVSKKMLDKVPFSQLSNITGNPSMSVPLHWTENNLPVGSMFCGPFGDEITLFQLAKQLEEARPWFNRRPLAISP